MRQSSDEDGRRICLPCLAGVSDAAAREAVTAVLRYFDRVAPNHHADEEDNLFPALVESMAGSDAACLYENIAALCADHRALDRRRTALHTFLESVATGPAATLAADEVQAFADLYASHIAREEGELLPAAERLLGDAEKARIGAAMRRRRGLGTR